MQRYGDPPDDVREKNRVEPDVRIGAVQREAGKKVVTRPASRPRRLLDRRLEAVSEVEDDVRRLDARDRSRRELEIVRFHTRGRQVVDRVTRAGDALGGVCEGIEGGHERRFAARAARPATGRD